MPYNCIVLVKQVPDTANITAEAMKADGTVNRGALPAIFNPEDLNALETALEVKDRFGGTVTALTMGPPKAAEVLRACLYRGADRAILLTDRRAAASDTLATSYILAQAIKTIGNYDLVFAGRQAIDGDTAQVGPQCAEKLGIAQITYLEELIDLWEEGNGGSGRGVVRVRRNIGHGWEIVDAQLPVLITVVETANKPRPAAARRVQRFKRAKVTAEVVNDVKLALRDASDEERQAEVARRVDQLRQQGLLIEQWDLDKIGADLSRCGLAGSPTKVFRVQAIVLTKEGFTEVPATEEGVRQYDPRTGGGPQPRLVLRLCFPTMRFVHGRRPSEDGESRSARTGRSSTNSEPSVTNQLVTEPIGGIPRRFIPSVIAASANPSGNSCRAKRFRGSAVKGARRR